MNLSTMSDSEIAEMLAGYEEDGVAGVLDVQNLVEMPTDLLVDLVAALDLVDSITEGQVGLDYPWLRKTLEGEYLRRAGQMPLK